MKAASRSLLLLAVWLSLSSSVYADVSYAAGTSPGGKSFSLAIIDIRGTIRAGDYERFVKAYGRAREAFDETGYKLPVAVATLRLNSNGGDLSEALAIGAKAHALKMTVSVTSGSSCISACVFILAGGIDRYVDGRVGIHRPYFPVDGALTEEAQKRSYAVVERQVKAYLDQVNVPTSLFDKMFRVPPQSVRYLSATELQEMALSGADPYYEEAASAQMAASLGITKTEYLSRRAVAEKCMGLPGEQLRSCLGRAYGGQ